MHAAADAATGRARANSAPRPGSSLPTGARAVHDSFPHTDSAHGPPAGDMDQAMAMYLLSMGSNLSAQPQHAWQNGMSQPQHAQQQHAPHQSSQQQAYSNQVFGAQSAQASQTAYHSTPMDAQSSCTSTEAQPDRSPGAHTAYNPHSLYMPKDASPGSPSTGNALGNFAAVQTALQMQDDRTASPYPNALPGGPAAAAWLQAMMYQQYQQAGRNSSTPMASGTSTPGFTPGWGDVASFSTTPTDPPLGTNMGSGLSTDSNALSQPQFAHLLQMGGIPQQPSAQSPFGPSPATSDLGAARPTRTRAGRSHTISHGPGATHQAAGGVFATALKNKLNRPRAGTDAQEVPPSLLATFPPPDSAPAGMAGVAVPFNKKIMSETSLAHKLRVTSGTGTAPDEKESKHTEWGVLEPESTSSHPSRSASAQPR